MKLSNKHQSPAPSVIVRADFSGGLNTSTNADGITENQLLVAENIEVERNSGRLKTVAGTVDIFLSNFIISAAMYDEINKVILLVFTNKSVHVLNLLTGAVSDSVGTLNGNLYPVCQSWENGLLIATGGKLQYFDGMTLQTLTDSSDSNFVYTRASRVLTTSPDNFIRYSAVGDETDWTENDTIDSSDYKFVEIGYKDGGNIVGMVNLSQDVLIIKDNRRVYRLSGEFPNWSINEVSRNVECSGRLSFCAVSDSVFILGKNEVQVMQTTQSYGDVKPQNVASLIVNEIQKLPNNAIVRYVPPLNQVWFIGYGGSVMLYDLNVNAWYKRKFNSPVVDVISVGDEVFIVKADRISRLDEGSFFDSGMAMQWKFQAQRLISQHTYLLKRSQISLIPYSQLLYTGQISVGAVRLDFPIPARNIKIYKNHSRIYKNHTKICLSARKRFTHMKQDLIYDNLTPIYGNHTKIFSQPTVLKESRNVFRSKFLDIIGCGSGGGFLLNGITFEVVEV